MSAGASRRAGRRGQLGAAGRGDGGRRLAAAEWAGGRRRRGAGPWIALFGVAGWIALLVMAGCRKAGRSIGTGESSGEAESLAPDAVEVAMEPREAEAWGRAAAGDEEDRMRLAEWIGCSGLQAHANNQRWRATAIRAMAYCDDFSELPWLADVATAGVGDDADEALRSIVEQSARPRAATDPDDAFELARGCAALAALARDGRTTKSRRVLAMRALRMLAERGCAKVEVTPDLGSR